MRLLRLYAPMFCLEHIRGNVIAFCFGAVIVSQVLALNNVILVTDKIFLPEIDLSIWRLLVALISFLILLYGLIWDAN